METKFTKGPWDIKGDYVISKTSDKEFYVICDVNPITPNITIHEVNKEESDENAKLIAAAPAMLETLKKIANWKLPETGRFWDNEQLEPMSFETCYGSNGARDYIKDIANMAIKKTIL